MKKIRVAQVIGNIFEGGVESVIMNYFSNIDTSKVTFDFFVERSSKVVDKEKIEALGGNVVIVPHYTHFFKYIRTMKRLLKEGNYGICHANMTTLNVFPLWCAKKAGIKVRISHAHNTANKSEGLRNVIKKVLRPTSSMYATHRLACGNYAGKWLFGSSDFTVVNNAVDLTRFKYDPSVRSALRTSLGLTDSFVIGHIGRFCPQKNHKFLVDVFNAVLKKKPSAKLLLIGEGPDFEEVRSYVSSLHLDDFVIFAGSQKKIEDYYQVMDVFVLPSLYEGLPVVSVEAQTNGLKCLFSDCITQEAKLLDSTDYLPLTLDSWVNALLSPVNVDRNFGFGVVAKTKFNIKNEAAKLLEYYESALK